MQARMKAAAKETRPTSMASNAQPTPEATRSLRLVERQSVEALVAGELRGLR